MNNEPVAWRNLCVGNIGEDSEWIYNEIGQGEPLYTHPANLTDEEIANTWKECGESDIAKDMQPSSFLKYFARAILKKASEK